MIGIFEGEKKFIEKVNMDLSSQEEQFVRQSLAMQEIPYPKLSIKDPNTFDKKGEYPTRLVIPATNFTLIFYKIQYPGIK